MTISSIHKINEDLSNLNRVLREYDYWMKDFEEELRIDGKKYSQANSEQAGRISYYSELSDELGVIVKEMDMRCKVARTKAMKKLMNVSSKSYTEKQLSMMIDDDPEVIKSLRALREVEERHEKSKTMVAGFIQRGYTLKNMSLIRTGGFHDEIMYVNEE